jgi:hypothetical protein
MSKTIFINNIDTPLGQALYNEFYDEANPDATTFLGTYLSQDSSAKLKGVKKMLKVIPSPRDPSHD